MEQDGFYDALYFFIRDVSSILSTASSRPITPGVRRELLSIRNKAQNAVLIEDNEVAIQNFNSIQTEINNLRLNLFRDDDPNNSIDHEFLKLCCNAIISMRKQWIEVSKLETLREHLHNKLTDQLASDKNSNPHWLYDIQMTLKEIEQADHPIHEYQEAQLTYIQSLLDPNLEKLL